MTNKVAPPENLKPYLAPLAQRKPKSVTAIDISELSSYTDTIVIIEAGSSRQVTTIAEHLIKQLKEIKIKALGKEGVKEGEWALLDYGAVIIHVFETQTKSLYDLEGFWADAPRIDLSQFSDFAIPEDEDDEF